MTRALVLSIAIAASASLVAAAQQQVRDTTSMPKAGTARVLGQVLSAGTDPKPLRRVIVTITGDGMKVGRSTVTDDQGRFTFEGLAAGRHHICRVPMACFSRDGPACPSSSRPARRDPTCRSR
jgi:hypothetical protein